MANRDIVSIQQTDDSLTSKTHTSKLQNVENDILKILNKNKITLDEFDKIISSLIKRKSSAYLNFTDGTSNTNENDIVVEVSSILSGSVPIPENRQNNLWY